MDNLPDLIDWESSSDDASGYESGDTYLNALVGDFNGDDSCDTVFMEEDGKYNVNF